MAIVKMRKIRIAALLEDRDKIIKTLQNLGVVDINNEKSEKFENDGNPAGLTALETITNDIKESKKF